MVTPLAAHTPEFMKATTHPDHQPVIVTVPPTTITRYLEASEQVEQQLGASPGPEFLMSLAVEHEDALELVDLFCGEIIDALLETPTTA